MVYCGKPSRACSECRIKRRKCDLSRPACRQCVRAGSRCDGYRDENFLTFRDQTAETLSKVSLLSDNSPILISHHNNQGVSIRPARSQQAEVHQLKERPHHDPWLIITVPPEDQALHFFFHHYVVHGSGRAPSHPDCVSIMYTRATGPGYLANLVNAVGLVSLAYLRNVPTLTHAASQTFSRALRDMRVALADPTEAASDQMLVAVMLLALYETVTSDSDDNLSSWDRHVDGALALIQLRGVGQLRNRIGRCIFLNLRTEILINCLQRGLRVPTPLINSMIEARNDETAQEAPAARLADMIVNVCAIIASVKEDIVDKTNLSRHVSALLSIDTDLECWKETLPVDYEYRTLTGLNDLREVEAYMGRYDIYSSVEVAHAWNLQRCARITVRRTLIEALSKQFHRPSSQSTLVSLPIAYRPLLHTSDTVIQENSSDICYSVPYILHTCDKAGKPSDLRAARILHLLWPLYIAGTAHTASNSLRDWIVSTMKKIEEATGIQNAKLVALNIQRRCLFS